MASSKSLPGVRMVTPTGRPAPRSSSGSPPASPAPAAPRPPSRPGADRPPPPASTFSTRRSATPRPAIAASQAQPLPRLPGYVPSAVVGAAALLGFVGGGDGAGDQGRGHVAVGEDPVVEAAQAEGVAEAGLGGGAEAFQLEAADQ